MQLVHMCDKARLFLNHLLYSSPSADYFNTKHTVWQKNCWWDRCSEVISLASEGFSIVMKTHRILPQWLRTYFHRINARRFSLPLRPANFHNTLSQSFFINCLIMCVVSSREGYWLVTFTSVQYICIREWPEGWRQDAEQNERIEREGHLSVWHI